MTDKPRQTFQFGIWIFDVSAAEQLITTAKSTRSARQRQTPRPPRWVPYVTGTPAALGNADPLGAVLDKRVRDAARTLAFGAARMVFDPTKPGLACASVAELRDALDRLGDAAGFADLHAGVCREVVAARLGLSMAAARRRFGDGTPPEVPLMVVIASLEDPP